MNMAGGKKMKNFEKLNSMRNGELNQEMLISELKALVNETLETADKMLDRVPENILRNIAVCTEYVDLNNAYSEKNGQAYTISYCSDGNNDKDVVTANLEEIQKLETFRCFLLERYAYDWSYMHIYFNEEIIYFGGETLNDEAEKTMLEHLKKAFPDKEIYI